MSTFVVICFSQFSSRFRDQAETQGFMVTASLDITLSHQYTAQQQAFVANLANGMDKNLAAEAAGYSKEFARVEANRLLQQPAILAAVQIAVAKRLAVSAPLALNVLEQFAMNEAMHPKIRLDAAKTLLDRAGVIAPKAVAAGNGADKPLNEMSTSELRTLADKLEGEIAGRAKTVSSATAAPKDTQALDDII